MKSKNSIIKDDLPKDVTWDKIDTMLKKEKYKKLIDRLSNETLRQISKNPVKALEAALKGLEKEEPEKSKDVDYLQALADGMQKLAQKVLDIRTKN